jgi:hypothetical protein
MEAVAQQINFQAQFKPTPYLMSNNVPCPAPPTVPTSPQNQEQMRDPQGRLLNNRRMGGAPIWRDPARTAVQPEGDQQKTQSSWLLSEKDRPPEYDGGFASRLYTPVLSETKQQERREHEFDLTAPSVAGNRPTRPVYQPDKDQALWLQFFRQFRRFATSQEEFDEYKRFWLSQFQPLDELMQERQFTNTNIHNPFEERDLAYQWINGYDMSTFYHDIWQPQYDTFGDPMAELIQHKAYRC